MKSFSAVSERENQDVKLNASRDISRFNLFESYKDIARDAENMNSHDEFIFSLRFAALLDDVFISNNLDYLSPEQRKTMKSFFNEADTGVLSNKNNQLDIFLGGI